MSRDEDFTVSCPLPISEYPEVLLAHGGGGGLTHRLIESVFLKAFANPALEVRHDGAVLEVGGARLAFTTDSYVVRPYVFPGGDIGTLAVNGTVNDLAMCGARPLYLSAGMILEEGLAMADLWGVVLSMRDAAANAGVQLVTGDTKVVDKGSGDGIFINTAGIGIVEAGIEVSPQRVQPGDAVILSGDIGRHGIAVMSAREGLEFEGPLESDTATLCGPVLSLIESGIDVHCLRDPTRGGLATTLVEIAEAAAVSINIAESAVPISEGVRGVCEILGLDPLYVANEGRLVAFVAEADAARALRILRTHAPCSSARVIGSVSVDEPGVVAMETLIGGSRVLDMLSGEQLPRIC
jgi:hydrogenase expression/formation protein HypE